ncbi:hypothetical protein RRF57_011150 [Xylaria bambusicola]|uniref:Uncharacterized protein n=1 Tax=Xylaria bambusicola TaxID=326684 RepID=A0AAN7ZDX4_9PEZI
MEIQLTVDASRTQTLDGSAADENVNCCSATTDATTNGKDGDGADGKPSSTPKISQLAVDGLHGSTEDEVVRWGGPWH